MIKDSNMKRLDESMILQKGQTGFGILIEHDAGFIGDGVNKDVLNENFEPKANEPVLVNCILQKWGVKNKNGRIYPKDVLIQQVNEYQELVGSNSAVSEADHPECVNASESMICTKNGWKLFKDISDDDIFEANLNKDGSISYIVSYYNGGCCFEEALETAIEKLEGDKNDKKSKS